jgi:hypothetical protein
MIHSEDPSFSSPRAGLLYREASNGPDCPYWRLQFHISGEVFCIRNFIKE